MKISFIVIILTILFFGVCMPADNYPNISNSFDKKELKEHVKFLSELTPARNYLNIQSLDAASDYIEQKFIKYGYSPLFQVYQAKGRLYKNIIASYGNPDLPVFVIGAHYDVCGNQPGADDNASGVAALLSLAREFSQKKPALPFRIEFVAFTLEEPPFFRTKNMGSYVHAKSMRDKHTNVIGMVCLEMLGYFTSEDNSQSYPIFLMKLFYPSKGDFIAVVGNFNSNSLVMHFFNNMRQESLKVEKLISPSILPGVDFSDHKNYWKFGYKAIMITDTAFYRNKNYHEVSDTIETINFTKLAEVTNGIYFAVTKLKLMLS